jgi:hypothetical protein
LHADPIVVRRRRKVVRDQVRSAYDDRLQKEICSDIGGDDQRISSKDIDYWA